MAHFNQNFSSQEIHKTIREFTLPNFTHIAKEIFGEELKSQPEIKTKEAAR